MYITYKEIFPYYFGSVFFSIFTGDRAEIVTKIEFLIICSNLWDNGQNVRRFRYFNRHRDYVTQSLNVCDHGVE